MRALPKVPPPRAFVRFGRLPAVERRATFEAAVLLCGLRALFRFAPASGVGLVMRRACAESAPWGASDDSERVQPVVRSVERAARRLPGTQCLPRAVAAWLMLRRRAVNASVRLGAGREGSRLIAHAWLECREGVVLGGEQRAAYTEFPRA